MLDPIVLVVIDIISEVLFNNLVKSFRLSIGLEVKNYRKLVVHF